MYLHNIFKVDIKYCFCVSVHDIKFGIVIQKETSIEICFTIIKKKTSSFNEWLFNNELKF